jgi:hypothetical protein
MNIFNLPCTEEEAVAFLQKKSVLPAKRICPSGHQMKLYFSDRVYWICNVKACRKKVNMRVNNWFEGSRLSFVIAGEDVFEALLEAIAAFWPPQTQMQ